MKKSVITLAATTLAFAAVTASFSASAAYKEIAVSNGGSIAGKVSFTGTDPAPKIYAVTKDNDICGTTDREIDFVKVNNGGLSEAVVFLEKVKEGKAFADEKGKIDQKGCEFAPFLSVMTNKSDVDAVNVDPILHNIHTYELISSGKKFAKKTVFNISQPDKGTVTKHVKLKRGNAMKVECDAHDFMHGFVFVAKNPYYAIVDTDGNFKIDNVPAGKYKIKAWHGSLGEKKGKVEVAAGGEASINFEFK